MASGNMKNPKVFEREKKKMPESENGWMAESKRIGQKFVLGSIFAASFVIVQKRVQEIDL